MGNWDEQKLTAPEYVEFKELGGEAVLLNLENEMYYGLDEIGTRMYRLLTTSDSVQAAMEAILEEFDVTPEKLEEDMVKMINDLQAHGLLETADK